MSIDLSLDRIRKLLDLLPPYTRPTIHVAGTNGKGSVCALVSSILTASSPPFVVGRFNSPHLVSVLDCICIDNAPVSRDVYSAAREQVERTDRDHGIAASNFELLTCTALLIFERAAVDVVVLEVGMGGRLDATNAVPDHCILVSALTAVDLDHQAFLGNTVEAITREKAAIARPGKPFVIGPQLHAEAADVARSVVEAVGAVYVPPARVKAMDEAREGDHAPFVAGCEAPPPRSVQIDMAAFADSVCADLPLHGEHQLANLEVAAGIISALLTYPFGQNSGLKFHSRITRATLARGILNTRWPGRLSYHVVQLAQPPSERQHSRRMTVLADGAHNPASASALADYLLDILKKAPSDSPRRPLALTYILALSHSPPKTPAQTLAPLFALCEHIPQGRQVRIGAALLRFTPPEGMPWVRPVPPSEMRTAIKSLDVTTSSDLELWPGSNTPLPEENDPTRTLEQALQWAATRQGDREDALVVVAGSLYLVADFYRLLDRLGQAQGIWGAN
ncbi:Mur ligase [Trametes coccinea BRFM310]|uniref:Mur ligase n=1 Tax=Trametes coccinea (strain BRFM310) TaxID=1353009 RepID=A0A1Y2J2E4_TRAC3|nr:Mur ligase [Trametes coccinea BRFM310]